MTFVVNSLFYQYINVIIILNFTMSVLIISFDLLKIYSNFEFNLD